METNNAPAFNAKPPPLTSDQLNYLIWRCASHQLPILMVLVVVLTGFVQISPRIGYDARMKIPPRALLVLLTNDI